MTWFTFWLLFCSSSADCSVRLTSSPELSPLPLWPYEKGSEYGDERPEKLSRWLLVRVGLVCKLLAAEAVLGEGRGCGCGCMVLAEDGRHAQEVLDETLRGWV